MQRIHYLDNLRAWAMLLGVYLHAAFAYANPAQSVWLATDPGSSRLVDSTIWFIHLFRMSLFFWLSGYFAKLVIQRKGVQTFLLSRLLRIVVPFVLFYPFLLAAIAAVIIFSLSYLESPRGLMGLIAQAAKSSSGDSQSQPLTTMHLWFLYYLMIFSILGVSLSRIDIKRWIPSRIAPWIWLLCPLALLPGVMGTTVPLPAPESFWPHWWPLAFYGLFYLAGWQTRGREEWLQRLQPYTWWIVLASCGLYGLYYLCMPVNDSTLKSMAEGSGTAAKLI